MAKEKNAQAGLSAAIIYTMLAPVLGSVTETKAAVFLLTAFSCGALAWCIVKTRRVPFSRTTVLCLLCTIVAFAAIFYTSNKGSQFYLFTIMFQTTVIVSLCETATAEVDGAKVKELMRRAMYYSATLCAVFALLYQVFICSDFLRCRMDFGSGSSYAVSVIMSAGMMCALYVYRGRKKTMGFFFAMAVMMYVYIFARSAAGYIILSASALMYSLKDKKKIYMTVLALAGLFASVLYKIILTVSNYREVLSFIKAAFCGVMSVGGLGSGGYNAVYAAVEQGYSGSPPVIVNILESCGIAGLLLAAALVFGSVKAYTEKKSVSSFAAMLIFIGMLFSSSEHMTFGLPLTAAYYALEARPSKALKGKLLALPVLAAGLFMAYMTACRVPHIMGRLAIEDGNIDSGIEYYSTAAEMELFNSEGWIKAYEGSCTLLEESGGRPEMCVELLNNAISFDKANIVYRIELADVYTALGRYEDALKMWDNILRDFDNEKLYPGYALKIHDVMKIKTGEQEYERELYKKLEKYAMRSSNREIVKEVNDIMAKAQRFYVASIEGVTAPGDMYSEPTEPESETETETETEAE